MKWSNMPVHDFFGFVNWWVASHSVRLLTSCLLLSFYTECPCYWSYYSLCFVSPVMDNVQSVFPRLELRERREWLCPHRWRSRSVNEQHVVKPPLIDNDTAPPPLLKQPRCLQLFCVCVMVLHLCSCLIHLRSCCTSVCGSLCLVVVFKKKYILSLYISSW